MCPMTLVFGMTCVDDTGVRVRHVPPAIRRIPLACRPRTRIIPRRWGWITANCPAERVAPVDWAVQREPIEVRIAPAEADRVLRNEALKARLIVTRAVEVEPGAVVFSAGELVLIAVESGRVGSGHVADGPVDGACELNRVSQKAAITAKDNSTTFMNDATAKRGEIERYSHARAAKATPAPVDTTVT